MDLSMIKCTCSPGYICPLCTAIAAFGIVLLIGVATFFIVKRNKR